MKTIAILGCSNSTGEETRDWELDPEYYNITNATHREWYTKHRRTAFLKFFEENPEVMLTSDPRISSICSILYIKEPFNLASVPLAVSLPKLGGALFKKFIAP